MKDARAIRHLFVFVLLALASGGCGGDGTAAGGGSDSGADTSPLGDGAVAADTGVSADGGPGSDSGGADAGAGDGSTTKDAGKEGGAGDGGSAGGCPAALGVDAGYYTCKREFFVSPSGSDGNDGTSPAKALKTLSAASSKLALTGGDCVTAAPGTYGETFAIGTSGTADACDGYVVFRSATPLGAKIVGPTGTYSTVTVAASYVLVDGFDIQADQGHGIDFGTNDGRYFHHFTAVRNETHHCGGAGLSGIHSDHVRLEANLVHDNTSTNGYDCSGISLWELVASDTAPGFHNVIRNNFVYKNIETMVAAPTDGNGIIIDSFKAVDQANHFTTPYGQKTLIENNIVFGNGARGIHVLDSDHVTVRNNTVFDDNRDAPRIGGTWNSELSDAFGADVHWENNIAVVGPDDKDGAGPTRALMNACTSDPTTNANVTFANNIAFSMQAGDRLVSEYCTGAPPISTTANLIGIDPALAQPSLAATSPDAFRIGATSKAAGAGTSSDMAPFDFTYRARPSPPSIGAFEP